MQIVWPSRSFSVHVLIFSTWILKSKIYETKPRDQEELKTEIQHHAAAIPKTMFAKVYENFDLQLHTCIENEVSHFHDVIFKTTKLSK